MAGDCAMQTLRDIDSVSRLSQLWRARNLRLALVPTMGFLHEGHLSLIRLARQHADRVMVSIFVNPTQFGPNEDLASYPRDFARDEQLCRQEGVDAVFYPEPAGMYAADHSTWVDEESLSGGLCGASRPGHFRGVCTVVLKLFNISGCQLAVFGRKDAQQALVIQRMVRDLNVPVRLLLAPLLREADGLALSSRNKYLSLAERQNALSIYQGLQEAEAEYKSGCRDAARLCEIPRRRISQAGGRIDYIELVSQDSLQALDPVKAPALLALAAYFGKTRLIDNIFLD